MSGVWVGTQLIIQVWSLVNNWTAISRDITVHNALLLHAKSIVRHFLALIFLLCMYRVKGLQCIHLILVSMEKYDDEVKQNGPQVGCQ